MIQEIISIAAERGIEITPLIDHYALNNYLDKRHDVNVPSYYVMLPKQSKLRYGMFSASDVQRIELVAVMSTDFDSDDRKDCDNVGEAVKALKEGLVSIIEALMESEQYDNIDAISFVAIPYRYDSFTTAVTATFNLSKPYTRC